MVNLAFPVELYSEVRDSNGISVAEDL